MSSDWRLNKDDIVECDVLRSLGNLLIRTGRLETQLVDGLEDGSEYTGPPKMQAFEVAADCLRDMGLSARAGSLLRRWNKVYDAWLFDERYGRIGDLDSKSLKLLGEFNEWLRKFLQWLVESAPSHASPPKGKRKGPSVDEAAPTESSVETEASSTVHQDDKGKQAQPTPLPPEEPKAGSTGGVSEKQTVAPRDDLFLKWYEAEGTDTYHSHASIRDVWSKLPEEERTTICPKAPGKVSRDTVKTAIKRARAQRG